MAKQKHKLGFGVGSIIEDDGTAGFLAPATMTQAFRVRIADVTGFSVAKGNKMMERTLHVLGNGTTLASAQVNHGAAEKIEAWFRGHPLFATAAPANAPAGTAPSTADELMKLGDLHAKGVLSAEEFSAAKARLLGS